MKYKLVERCIIMRRCYIGAENPNYLVLSSLCGQCTFAANNKQNIDQNGTIEIIIHKLRQSARTDGACNVAVHELLSCTAHKLGT